jgi:hypothetical protein
LDPDYRSGTVIEHRYKEQFHHLPQAFLNWGFTGLGSQPFNLVHAALDVRVHVGLVILPVRFWFQAFLRDSTCGLNSCPSGMGSFLGTVGEDVGLAANLRLRGIDGGELSGKTCHPVDNQVQLLVGGSPTILVKVGSELCLGNG